MTAIEIITGVLTVLNIGGLMGTLIFFKSSRKKAKAEADCAEADANSKEWGLEEQRIRHLHEMIETNNATIGRLLETIDSNVKARQELNAKIDDLSARGRELSDRTYRAERDLNRANGRIITLTEERDAYQRRADYYRMWRCQRNDCQDPRGREPENPHLKDQTYEEPE